MSDLNTFEDLVKKKLFIIPINQRGFSWNTENFMQLLTDLKTAVSRDKNHYFGPIIISFQGENLREDDGTHTLCFKLEDGQQRVTSIFFLLKTIKDQMIELSGECNETDRIDEILYYKLGGEKKLRIENNHPDLNEFLTKWFDDRLPHSSFETSPMKSMRNALDWCNGEFKNTYLVTLQDCKDWKNKLLLNAKFNQVDLERETVDPYLTFDAINSRGMPLSQFDKIKNFCIMLDSVLGLESKPDEKWFKSLELLDKFGVSDRKSEEDFIRELYNVFHDQNKSSGQIHKEFSERYWPLVNERKAPEIDKLRSFIDSWPRFATSFGLMASPDKKKFFKDNPSRENGECSKIAGEWLVKLDNMDLKTITRPILVTAHISLDEQNFEKISKACEIFTFRVYGTVGKKTSHKSKEIIKLANEILLNLKDENYIISKLCKWLKEDAPLSNFLDELGDGKNKYNWKRIYYFLYEYELCISPRGMESKPFKTQPQEKLTSIEHILPQNYSRADWWKDQWNELDGERNLHRLGNLVLTDGNSFLGSKPIDRKLEDPGGGYCYNCDDATNSEKYIKEYTDGTHWNKDDIKKREIDFIKKALKRWSVPCISDNGEVQLEQLEENFIVNEIDCYGEEGNEEEGNEEEGYGEEFENAVEEDEQI